MGSTLADVTGYQWLVLVLGTLGFIITWTRSAVTVTRAVDAIKSDTTEKINAVKEELTGAIAAESSRAARAVQEAMDTFREDQDTQDQRYAELISAVRAYVQAVEKEMHAIEIWGRDNYVLKTDFTRAIDSFSKTLDDIAKTFRDDTKSLNTKMDAIILGKKEP